MYRKVGIFVLVMFFVAITGYSQKGTIRGNVSDGETNVKIPFATVAVVSDSNDLATKGTITNDQGQFEIDKLAFDRYSIVVSFMGYHSDTIKNVVLAKSNSIINLKNVGLSPANINIEGVEVTAMAQSVSTKIDRKTYRTADFETARGGNAVDVLNKLPSVSVDPDGVVSVRGTTDFMVYLNGKPTQMEASVLLGQIQSESIESIDVITVPTAKYDAQGKGGIINISTKRTGQAGLSIAANGLLGGAPWNNLTDPISGFDNNDNRYGGGFSLMYHKDAVSLYGGANYKRRNVNGMRTGDARLLQEDGSYYHMVASGERPEWFKNYSANAGIDFHLSDQSTLSASYYYGNRQEGRSAFYVYNNFYGDKDKNPIIGIPAENEYVYNPNTDDRYGEFHTSNLDYNTKFETSQLNISFLYEYSKLSRELDNEDYEFDNDQQLIEAKKRHFRQSDEAPLHGYRLSIDYEKELDNGHVMSFGVQPQWISHTDDFSYDTLNVVNQEWGAYSSLENAIDLNRSVYAGYVDYSGKWNKLTFIGGVRLEYTDQQMDISNPDYFTIFDRQTKPSYEVKQWDWFPTAHLSYELNELDRLSFAASKRINRPPTKNMAPFLYRRHYEVYLVGDPDLEPEYLSNIEMSYNKKIGKQNFVLTGFYRGTDNAVFRVNTIYANDELGDLDPDHNKVLVRSYTNAGNTTALGAELNANIVASSKVKVFLGGSLYHYAVKADVFGYKEDNSSTNWNLKGNMNWLMMQSLKFTADFDLKSATVTAQGQDELFYMANAAVNYSPQKLKGWDFSLRVLDILASNNKGLSTRAFDSNSQEIFYQDTEYRRQGPIVELGISYAFNMKGKSRKKADSTFGKEQF